MLIHLSEHLADGIEKAIEDSGDIIQAIQNIAQARSQGDHMISGSAKILDKINSNPQLSLNTRRIFSRISAEQAQIGLIRNKLKIHIEITSLFESDLKKPQSSETIKFSLQKFAKNHFCQPTFLIAENINDCDIFLKISSWFQKKYSNNTLPSNLKAIYIPGGGDTTADVLSHFSKEQRYFIFAITDSDKNFPESKLGQTTKRCKSLKLTELCLHTTLPVRSIENLFWYDFIKLILEKDHERKVLVKNLQRLKHLSSTDTWKWLSFKEGIYNAGGPNKKNSKGEYWDLQPKSAEKGMDVDHLSFPPISPKLLSWVAEHLRNGEPADIFNDQQLYEIWKELALLVCSWTCASAPMRS